MSELNRDNILQTLPSVLANDAGMQPLGETTASMLALMWAQVDLPAIYTRIDELPEDLLDILAKDFKVDWYDYNHPLETKRLVIKDSFYVHKHLGTVGAVKRALSDIWPSVSLEEWFDYGGVPYHFRVAITDNDFTAAKKEQAIKAISLTKNVRSALDGIYIDLPERRAKTYIGTALYNALTIKMRMADVDFDALLSGCLHDETNAMLIDENGLVMTD